MPGSPRLIARTSSAGGDGPPLPGAQETGQQQKGRGGGHSLLQGLKQGVSRKAKALAEPPPGPPATWASWSRKQESV